MSEETKTNDNGQSDAEHIVALTRRVAPINTMIEELKVELRKREGQTFTTEDGSTVKITKTTADRPGETIVVFDEDKFNELTDDQRAILFDSGVVKTSRKITKGRAASVTVKLA